MDVDAIPMPEGKSLYPYQVEGVKFLVRTKKSYLTDEMGLGKTVQVIGFTNFVKPEKILIVCPASLKFNWESEYRKFSTNNYQIQIIKSNSTKINDDANIIIVSYGTLANGIEKYRNRRFDLIVLDESHYIKNFAAKRTKAVTSLDSEYKIALTGTPILNRPAEIYSTVNWLDPSVLGSRHEFLRRHCSLLVFNPALGMLVESWRGAHHLEEIREKLYGSVMLRRKKSEVLTQLPSKTRQVIEVAELKAEYRRRHEELLKEFPKIKGLISDLEQKEQYSQEFLNQLAIERHKTALAKVPLCAKYIVELLDSKKKLVVFAHHKDVITSLGDYLLMKGIKFVKYVGGMTDLKKSYAVHKFQNDEDVRVFIGSIRASGVGINLTKADLVLFLELDFTPAIMLQAEDRVHRIGQNKRVLIQYFVFRYGIDAMLVRMLIRKMAINDGLLGHGDTLFEDADR